jgi:N6-adenosine-specific RNA methylase IME4
LILFGVKGNVRTLDPGRSQVNIIRTQKQEHSRKPDELYEIIEKCSVGPYLEIFARGKRKGWDVFGDQSEVYQIEWATYANHSQVKINGDELLLNLQEPSYEFIMGIGKQKKESKTKS